MIDIVKVLVFILLAVYAHKWMWANACGKSTRVVFWVILIRFILASFPNITYPQLIGPFSLVSLYSIFVVGFIFLFFLSNHIEIKKDTNLLFIGLILTLMVFAAVINSHYIQSVASLVKWLMLLQLTNLVFNAVKEDGAVKVLQTIGFSYLYPIIMLVASVVLGVSKATENDGSTSYVGGFNHEAVFSVIILSGMFMFILKAALERRFSLLFLHIGTLFVLLFLVNYRTSILACLGLFATAGLMVFLKSSMVKKVAILFLGFLAITVVANIDSSSIAERFAEIPQALASASSFTVLPEFFDSDERRFFSGRIFFWASYIHEALNGSVSQIWFGHGMDSWKGFFEKYAHNTFVSFFYEVGFVGLFLLLVFFTSLTVKAFKGENWLAKILLVGAISAFIILNVATMPLWQIEGVIFLSILIALIDSNKKIAVKQNNKSMT